MTSLLPLLPDGPRLPATDALAGGPAAASVPAAGTPDFAGLLETLAAPGADAPGMAAFVSGSIPDGTPGAVGTPPLPLPPRAEASSESALAAWPGGKNLPEPGAPLPPALPSVVLDAAVVPASAAESSAPADQPPLGVPGLAAHGAAVLPDAALRPDPGKHVHARSREVAAPARGAVPASAVADAADRSAPSPQHDTAFAPQPEKAGEPAAMSASASEAATAPQQVVQALPFAPMLPSDAVTAPPVPPPAAAALPAAVTVRVPVADQPEAATAAPTGEVAGEARPALPASPAVPFARARAPGASVQTTDAAPVLALAVEPTLASAPGAGALPDAEVPAAPASTSAAAPAAATPAALPFPERPAEPRPASATPPAPQLESAIAQVGDIREALRNARPAMTLTHAEFGAVSLRLEPAAPDQWRAVLASRDPGFVPAIHAALADRAVAAAAETSAGFSGHSGASHNGAGDQRYGSSPNQGQGSPQPYLGQSGARDGEAAPDHRHPSTAAALAARGGDAAEDPAASPSASGGLFA